MADDSLERLSKKLDAGKEDGEVHRSHLFPKAPLAPAAWRTKTQNISLIRLRRKRFTPFETLFIGSAVFFVVAVCVAVLLFFFGNNTISTKNVNISIAGPTAIGAGDTLSLQVVITNRNAVPMQLTDLVVEFPPGTRSDSDVSVTLPRLRESLGTINPGESVNRTVKAVIFGVADTDMPIKVSAEYRVPSSNAIFVSDSIYTAHINQSPASISVNVEKEAVSGQETSFTITLTSNSPQVLKDMILMATYPPGFSFESASPTPASGNATWDLGDIESSGTRTITIKGMFTGEDGDLRVINITAGNRKSPDMEIIAAPLATAEADITVTKPFISVALSLNQQVSPVHTVMRGKVIDGQIQWTNNLPDRVENLRIEVDFTGPILDKNQIQVPQGFYNSSGASIVWDKTTDTKLSDVAPGQSDTFPFIFATLPVNQGTFKNPEVDLSVTVHADRQTEANVPETVNSTTGTKVLVATDLVLTPLLVHTGGPLPPKVGTETVYTVSWTVTNSVNALGNTTVTANLPDYVKFKGNVSPVNEQLSYDDRQGTVTWTVGDMAARDSRTVSFQVGITPSLSQLQQTPALLAIQQATGFDRFVQDNVFGVADPLTTASESSVQEGAVTQ